MKKSALFMFLGACLAVSPVPPSAHAAESSVLTLQAGHQTLKVSLAQLKKDLPSVTLRVEDPVYTDKGQPAPTFDAFSLSAVIGLLQRASPFPITYDEIAFQAADGYAPSISLSLLRDHKAYLAYRVHGRSLADPFPKVRQGKAMLSPAPLYLIWSGGKKIGDAYPWPYQLVRIELVSFKEKYSRIYPVDSAPDSPERKGFTLFKTECIRCHSVNLVGGDIGPELNIPKNVLEYWKEETLRKLIRKTSSFRARDKMPDFPQLKDTDLDDLFAYFRYAMKHRPKQH